MGVAVLQAEDCLKLSNRMKHPNPCHNRTNRIQPNRRKRFTNTSLPLPPTVGPKVPAKSLVMGQVKILKRGEDAKKSASEFERENLDLDVGSAKHLGFATTQIRLTESNNNSNKVVPAMFYAGSAFITAPPPSSVPMPVFFTKKSGVDVKNDDATSHLRRILRLDL